MDKNISELERKVEAEPDSLDAWRDLALAYRRKDQESIEKTQFLIDLKKRRKINKEKIINNSSLPAGSPMYYYCQSCCVLVARLPETHLGAVGAGIPRNCHDCQKHLNWIKNP